MPPSMPLLKTLERRAESDLRHQATVNLGLKQIASAVMDASIAYEHQTVYTRDHAEAVNAFLEKRDPVFTGK
jgi:enoyl-CoA hydratase